ncbi:MAG: ASKHA domain-containing protein [Nitrospirota bacterium]
MKKHMVIFQPAGRRGEVDEGKTLLEAARDLGVDLESICGSKKTCGKCKVRIDEGYFEKDAIDSRMSHLSQLIEDEKKFIKPEDGPNIRLACTAEIQGDVKIFVPEKSRAGKQVVRKTATERAIALNPAVKKYHIELTPPTLHDITVGDSERVTEALKEKYGLNITTIDFPVLRKLQDILREGKWEITVSVWIGREIVKVEPGFVEDTYGIAVDVGTTTVVGYLCDLTTGRILSTESMMNPQVPYGEDVMSRITYAMMNTNGLEKMQGVIIDGLNQIITTAVESLEYGGKKCGTEDIVDMTIVFNTAMHHIFLGFNPEYIGKAPFIPAVQKALNIKARDMGIKINGSSYIHVLPIEAGFVGADNVGVLIAEEPYNQDSMELIIDIGTNGELLLGNRDRIYSTSCATGPAYEGAQIKFGMRAAPGAIERVKIDPDTREVMFKVIGKTDWHAHLEKVDAKGICGSGIIDAVAEMFRAGVIMKNGNFNSNLNTPRFRRDSEGKAEFVIAWADETSVGTDITITLGDIRAIQLAKAALYAGAKLLMNKLGIKKIDKVILAGAFGSYIDKESAMIMGMFPDCDIKNVYAVGNAAGDGARIALLNIDKRDEAERKAREVNFVEIAVDPNFQKEFVQAMHFPHMKDTFPNLKDLLERPSSPVEMKEKSVK